MLLVVAGLALTGCGSDLGPTSGAGEPTTSATDPTPADQGGIVGLPPETEAQVVTASYLAGRVGPGIKAVQRVLQNGQTARATLTNGWFAVWLPGIDATGAEAVRNSGV